MPVAGVIKAEAREDISPAARSYGSTGAPCSRPASESDSPERTPGAQLARRIGATGHAVLALSRGARGTELASILLSDFPGIAPAGARRLADCAQGSIRPFWWSQEAAGGLEGLRWALRLRGPLPGPAGLAFPVAAGQDGSGLVVFSGARLVLSDRELPDLHRECFGLFEAAVRQGGIAPRETVSLTRRERECVRLAADGLSSEEIAKALRLSLHTANQYLSDAARRLNANGRMHTVAKALRLGLID